MDQSCASLFDCSNKVAHIVFATIIHHEALSWKPRKKRNNTKKIEQTNLRIANGWNISAIFYVNQPNQILFLLSLFSHWHLNLGDVLKRRVTQNILSRRLSPDSGIAHFTLLCLLITHSRHSRIPSFLIHCYVLTFYEAIDYLSTL